MLNWLQLIMFSTISDPETDQKVPYWTNPSKQDLRQIKDMLYRKHSIYPHLRGIVDHETGKLHVWPANGPTHNDFVDQTGFGTKNVDKIYLTTDNDRIPIKARPKNGGYHIEPEDSRPLSKDFHTHKQIMKLGLDNNMDIAL